MKNARLIIAIITSLLDEAIILALVLWGLPKLGISLPLYAMVIFFLVFAAYAVITFKLGSKILKKPPLSGFTTMIGIEGRVVKRLAPDGLVRMQGEIWQSKAQIGAIEVGSDVVVVDQNGFKLVVRQKRPGDSPEAESP